MIPKIIHYCWFGGMPLPNDALKCIDSWRKYLPDYEVRVCDESNFDVNCCPYVAQAYEQKKYAYVSDYARFWLIYNYGGVYFDTDVEVIRPMQSLIDGGAFMGIEKSLYTEGKNPKGEIGVNPGLGFACEAGNPFFKQILNYYDKKDFDIAEGTIVFHTSQLLKQYGLQNTNTEQDVAGIHIYPTDVLCPMDSTTGIITITDRTVSIHHYSCSWMDQRSLSFRLHKLKNRLIRIFGPDVIMRLSRIIKK